MSNGGNERFVRWQGLTLGQFSQATNVVLGLAVAVLGFNVALLMNKEFLPVSWHKCVFALAVLAVLASISAGLWCLVNRLRDFRATTAVARNSDAADVETNRSLAADLGKFTWTLLWWQIATFAVGVLGTIVVVAAVFGTKLL
jgi:hypothetical protein